MNVKNLKLDSIVVLRTMEIIFQPLIVLLVESRYETPVAEQWIVTITKSFIQCTLWIEVYYKSSNYGFVCTPHSGLLQMKNTISLIELIYIGDRRSSHPYHKRYSYATAPLVGWLIDWIYLCERLNLVLMTFESLFLNH